MININTRKRRAISPVLSVLLMIVVAVAGALVTYSWSMGYLDLTTAKAGRAMLIQSTFYDDDADLLTIYVQNVGQGPINIDPANLVYLDGKSIVPSNPPAPLVLNEGDTIPVVVSWVPDTANQQMTIKLTGVQGTMMQATVIPETNTGGGGIIPPTVTRVLSTEAGFSGVEAGDLLVVIANTRTGTHDSTLTASASGYDLIEVAAYQTTTGNRRAVAILTKTAVGGESGAVTVTFGGSGVSTYETHYQVFRSDGLDIWTAIANGANHGTEPEVNSLTVPSAALPDGSIANVLSIGAMVWRDDPGTPSFTGLGGLAEFDDGGAYSATAYNYGLPVTSTDVTWPTVQRASGLLVQFECG